VKPSADHFAAVPAAWEERQSDFNPTARAVYVELLFSMNRTNGSVHLSLRALAERSGLERGQVDRGLRDLAAGGVIRHTPGSNQHSQTAVEVLLRRGAVLPMRQRAGTPAGHQQDSASHQQDSASHQQDSNRTAHPLSPATEPDRGLEGCPDMKEGADAPPDLSLAGSVATSEECGTCGGSGTWSDRTCPACHGSGRFAKPSIKREKAVT
jgi:hypothetical protein